MEPLAHDDDQERPIPAVKPAEIDLADEEGFPPYVPPAPQARAESPQAPDALELAEPGIYYCDDPSPGVHPVLLQLMQGENDFTGVSDPTVLRALALAVESGLLKKRDG